MADEDRPQYQSGIGTINGTQFHWGSGTPGKYWSIPYGDYPVTPNAPTGAWAHQVGAIPIANNVIPDPQLGRNRIGIMIHSGSAPSLDQLYTEGCFKVDPQDWPNVRSQILNEASKGPLYLHVAPGGVAAFTNTKTFSQAGDQTPAANANAAANTTANAQPSRPATTTPGTTRNSPLDIVLQAESGDRNINNTTQGTSSGQAQGNLQITTGTWNDFAPKAGVDLKQYPTPDSAPRNVQIAVGNTIPLNRWASSTVNAVLKQYPNIDTSKTLGEIQSAALGGAGGTAVASATPGTTINTTGALPGFADAKTSNQFLQNLDQFDKSLGGRGLGLQGQGQGEGQGQPDMPRAPVIPPPDLRNASSAQSIGRAASQMLPSLTHYQPQAYGQTLNSDPLAIGAGTPQQPDWLKNAGLQQAAQPSPYGTSIGSMQMAYGLSPQQLQMLMNPMMLSQSGGGYG